MSRIGRKPIEVPAGVKVTVAKRLVSVEGPKGKLNFEHHAGVSVAFKENQILVDRPNDSRESRSLHGMTRSRVANMIEGVTKGYEISLDVVGVGYKAELKGKMLTISAGLSYPVDHKLSDGIDCELAEKNTRIILRSTNKELIGNEAATIRGYRVPEPYKGKGIKYTHEQIKRKVGKSGAG